MSENLKIRKIIREAFNTTRNILILQEASATWAAKMTPEQITYADKLVEDAINQTGNWQKVHWTTGKNANANYFQNYIFDKLVEGYLSTHEDKYKWAIAKFFSPALGKDVASYFFRILYNTTGVGQLVVNIQDFESTILAPVLQRIFAGTKTEPAKFDTIVNSITTDESIGAIFNIAIRNECKDLIQHLLREKKQTISADASIRSTGSEDDDSNEDLFKNELPGAPEDEEDKTNLYDEPKEKTALDIAANAEEKELASAELSSKHQDNSKGKMSLKKLNSAFNEIEKISETEGISKNKIIVFHETVQGYLSPDEIAAKHSDIFPSKHEVSVALTNLKLDKKFGRISESVLKNYGFPSTMLEKIKWSDIYKIGKEIGKQSEEKPVAQEKPYVWSQYVGEQEKKM